MQLSPWNRDPLADSVCPHSVQRKVAAFVDESADWLAGESGVVVVMSPQRLHRLTSGLAPSILAGLWPNMEQINSHIAYIRLIKALSIRILGAVTHIHFCTDCTPRFEANFIRVSPVPVYD